MKKTNTILDQIEQKIAPSQNSLTTPAGPHKRETLSEEQKDTLTKVINECFELLRINYHHLYFSAYAEIDAVNAAKRLWLENLSHFDPDIIRHATHLLIRQSDFLPTISKLIKKCSELSSDQHLPEAHDAYIEACNSTSPKQNHTWSHPAVYYAGQKSNWRFLASNEEKVAYPIFKHHYESICEQLLAGQELAPIKTLALPENIESPLSKKENAKRLAELKSELKI